MPTATYTPLATVTLASTTSSVSFSAIPASYRDLVLIVNAATATEGNLRIQVNGDTGSNYSQVNMRAFGSGGTGSSSSTSTFIASNYSTGLASTDRAINIYNIMDYSATDKHKTFLIRANHPGELDALAGRWANTAAITSVTMTANAVFSVGSTYSLYGVIA